MRSRSIASTLAGLILLAFMTAGGSLHPARGQHTDASPAPSPGAMGNGAGEGGTGTESPAPASPDGPRVKIRVTEPSLGRSLTDAGGRLVADYGGFQVLAVDPATAAALAGQEGV